MGAVLLDIDLLEAFLIEETDLKEKLQVLCGVMCSGKGEERRGREKKRERCGSRSALWADEWE